MSRTKRAVPRDCERNTKTLADYLAEWEHVHRGAYHAHSCYRWNRGLGRDGGYHSGVYEPFKSAPNFINRWCDAVHKPSKKGHVKRELAQLRRRDAKKKIVRALRDLEDAR